MLGYVLLMNARRCISVTVNIRIFCSCQLLCAFEVRSLLPLTLSETSAQHICTKRCLKNLNYLGTKRAPARSFWQCGSNFSLKLQEKRGFPPHKRNNCRICLVDKFGNYHGRGRRLRTLGLRFWRPPLYQLSYSPIKLVGLQGLEPQTDRLWAGCSNQLS